jgi:hypothetical protein
LIALATSFALAFTTTPQQVLPTLELRQAESWTDLLRLQSTKQALKHLKIPTQMPSWLAALFVVPFTSAFLNGNF